LTTKRKTRQPYDAVKLIHNSFPLDDPTNPKDYEWFSADWRKAYLNKLTHMQQKWRKQEDRRNREFLARLLAKVASDKVLLDLEEERERRMAELQAAHDKRIEEIKSWWIAEHDREAKAADARRQAAAAKILSRVNKDRIRAERETLLSRGLVRGRR